MRIPSALALVSILVAAASVVHGDTQRSRPGAGPGLEVYERSIDDLQSALSEGRVTSRALVEAYLARIAAYDQAGPRLNSLVALNPRAREDADALDRERGAHKVRGPLHGIPVLVKDNYDTADMPTSGGSLGLATLRPERDAYQVRRLREAGAVILGKTTMHELAAGITTVASLTGQTRNPYDLLRVPGGSSGGTGAAVAASFAAAGMGSDTCGSIRIPAANQNLVGLRPTRGLSSRSGVMPLSDTQDVAGPLARSVGDLARMLDATVGPDPDDPVTALGAAHVPRSFHDGLKAERLKGARIGVLRALFGDAPEDADVGDLLAKALEAMKAQGAEIEDVVVPGFDELLRDSSVIGDEFKFDLAAYLAKQPTAPVKSLGEILDRGLYHQALEQTFRLRNAPATRDTPHYRQALVKRQALREAVLAAFDARHLDAMAYPTLRRKPTLIGEVQQGTTCQLSATTGLPAISMPAGFTPDGVPVGIELLGRTFADPDLLALAYSWEAAAKPRRPPFSTPPLVGGAAPPALATTVAIGSAAGASRAQIRLTFERTTGRVDFDVTPIGRPTDRVVALTLQRGADADRPGPVVAHLLTAGQTAARGTLVLRGRDREDLAAGQLYAHLYTVQMPLGGPRVRVAWR